MKLNQPDWEGIGAKAGKYDWAAGIVSSLRSEVDVWMAAERPLPTEGAGWYHNYFCPADGTRLSFDINKPGEHVCPACGSVYSGSPYDEAWVTMFQFHLQRAVRGAAALHRITAEPAYPRFVAEVLGFYAERYADTPVHGQWAGKGKIMGQGLTEAILLLRYAEALELCRDGLDPATFDLIARKLLVAGARFIVSQGPGSVHNIPCWHNAGVGVVGLVTGEEDLVNWAVRGEFGLDRQLAEGVLVDGFWIEGSIGYHFYALDALRSLCFALGEGYADHEALLRMFLAPLDYAYPDGSLWSNNDSWHEDSLDKRAPVYEYAHHFWPRAGFGPLLAETYETEQRNSVDALLFGEPLPQPGRVVRPSRVFEPSGFGILRGGSGDTTAQATLKFGPHGGGHGHPDKLALTYFAAGRLILPDLGSPGYGVPLHTQWCRRTAAHNTVVVDETDQAPCTGRLLHFEAGPPARIDAVCEDAYDGVALRRRLLLDGSLLVDLVDVEADEGHTVDLHMHVRGRLTSPAKAPPAPALGEEPPYSLYTNVRELAEIPTLGAGWDVGDGWVFQWIPAGPAGDCVTYVADCPDNPADRMLSAIIRRTRGSAAFLSVADTGRGSAPLSSVGAERDGEAVRVTVARADGTRLRLSI